MGKVLRINNCSPLPTSQLSSSKDQTFKAWNNLVNFSPPFFLHVCVCDAEPQPESVCWRTPWEAVVSSVRSLVSCSLEREASCARSREPSGWTQAGLPGSSNDGSAAAPGSPGEKSSLLHPHHHPQVPSGRARCHHQNIV